MKLSVSFNSLPKWQRLHLDRTFTLLDNANKYSAAGQPVEIRLNQQKGDFLLTVKDAGNGISATEIENIFERFVRFRKHNEGLGLSIAKANVEAHGGQIAVESSPGQGSSFTITFPTESNQ